MVQLAAIPSGQVLADGCNQKDLKSDCSVGSEGERAWRQEGRWTAKHGSVDLESLIWSKRNITAITSANELKRQKLGLKESILVSMTQEAVSLRQKSACEKGT